MAFYLLLSFFLNFFFGMSNCQLDGASYEKWIESYRKVSGNQTPPAKHKEWIRLAQELNVSYDPSDYKQIFSDLSAFKNSNLTIDSVKNYWIKIIASNRHVHGKNMRELISESKQNAWILGPALARIDRILDPFVEFFTIYHSYDEGMSLPDENNNLQPYNEMSDVFERNPKFRKIHEEYRNNVMLLQAPTSFVTVPFNVPIFSINRIRGYKDIIMPCRTGLPVYDRKYPIYNEQTPWERKLNVAMFRGTTTGTNFEKVKAKNIEFTCNPRMKLHEMTVLQQQGKLNCSVKLDFGITDICYLYETNTSFSQSFKKRFQLVDKLDYAKQFQSKYLVVVDGNGWPDRLATFMASGSLVFLATVQEEWVINQVKDMENIIMLKPDLSDLIEKLEWAAKNNNEAKRIATNGRKFALEHFRLNNLQTYNALLFMEYQNLFKNN